MKFLSLILTGLILSSCGFSPMYAQNKENESTSISANLNEIDISIIPDRSGQFLRNELIDRFYQNGYLAAPKYRLDVSPINERIEDFDITIESEATRQQIRLSTIITLINLETNKPVLSRSLYSITSNNILESEFSTLITEQSARDAALNDLARQIERQVALHFSK